MHHQDQQTVTGACEDHGIPLAKDVLDATALRDAAQTLLADTRAETAPDPDSITVKNLPALHAAMVAWPTHDDRIAAADRLASVADAKLSAAWSGFGSRMLEVFRKPFDDTAARVLAGDESAVAELQRLGQIRDILAGVTRRAHCRADILERTTRVLIVPSFDVALNRLRIRTKGHERLSAQWCRHAADLGCLIRWQTPAEQEAADRVLPEAAPAPSAA